MKRILAASTCFVLIAMTAPAAAAPKRCDIPGSAWETASPEAVGLDEEQLNAALDFARPRLAQEILVFRYGCLVAERRWFQPDARFDSWSIAKSVTAMATGRAVTLGLLDLDDRVGRYIERADEAHARITVEQLLTMSTGLHWNLFRDYNVAMADRVEDALSLRFDHEPGTWFEYAQSPVALLAEVVGRAAGEDFQIFVQRELFGPIGIGPERWTWERDDAGNTMGFMGLNMAADDYARLGHLMLNGGRWGSNPLLARKWVRDAVSPTRTNPGYGYMFWLNGSDRYIAPTVYSRDERNHRQIVSAPRDLYWMAGIEDQRVYVLPETGIVVVRFGGPGSREPDTRSSVFTSASGEWEHEFFRLLMPAVNGYRYTDPGPYEYSDPVPALDPEYGILRSAQEPEDWVEGFGRP
jgi:CubicO group peptidase (beta-lactamase class C family)